MKNKSFLSKKKPKSETWDNILPLNCLLIRSKPMITFSLAIYTIFVVCLLWMFVFIILIINVKRKPGKVKRQKNWLKRGERSDTYLTHVRLPQSVQGLERIGKNIGSFQPTLWLSSAPFPPFLNQFFNFYCRFQYSSIGIFLSKF